MRADELPTASNTTVTLRGMTITRKGRRRYCLRVDGSTRVRWGNEREILDDANHYETYGVLPAPANRSWA